MRAPKFEPVRPIAAAAEPSLLQWFPWSMDTCWMDPSGKLQALDSVGHDHYDDHHAHTPTLVGCSMLAWCMDFGYLGDHVVVWSCSEAEDRGVVGHGSS